MNTTRPNLDAMLLLEQPFARLPYDQLRGHFRAQQRALERELNFCNATMADLGGSAEALKAAAVNANGNIKEEEGTQDTELGISDGAQITNGDAGAKTPSTAEMEKSLDAMIGRLRGLKRKVSVGELSCLPVSLVCAGQAAF